MPAIHHRSCNLCEAMCGLVVEHEGREVLAIRGDPEDPLSRGFLCTKARALVEVRDDPDRLRRPLRRRGGDWEEIGWDEALDEAAERLRAVQARHGRNAVAVYIGNPTVHDYGAMIGAGLLSASLGTRSHFSATSVDHLPRLVASRLLYGHQGLLPVPDLAHTAWLLVVGANPAASNGSLMSAPGAGRRLRELRARGGKVVVIDPRRTETAALADEHHFIRPGTDALFLLAMLHVILAEGAGAGRLGGAGAFGGRGNGDDGARPPGEPGASRRGSDGGVGTGGLDELRRIVRRFPPERVAGATGIAAAVTRRLARELAAAPSAAAYGRVGACTQRFGGLTTWLLDLLAVVTGNLDRPGGLLFARPAVDLVRLGRRLGFGRGELRGRTRVRGLPCFDGQQPAAALAEEIDTPGAGQVRALVTLAGNPVLSLPHGTRLERALPGLDCMVAIDYYLNETTRFAQLILPPAHALEQDHYDLALHLVAVRNVARYSPPLSAPEPDGRRGWEILLGLAERLAPGGPLGSLKWSLLRRLTPARLLDIGLRLGPYGDRYLPWSRGLSLARLRRAPHGIDLGPLLPGRLAAALAGRAIPLVPAPFAADLGRLEATLDAAAAAAPAGGLVLIGRRHMRDNNSWLHNVARLTAGRERCTLLMHPDDAAARGVTTGQRVRLRSRTGAVEVAVEISDRVMPGVVSLPHGYGHHREGVRLEQARQRPGVSVNDVTDETLLDELTGNASLSGVPVEVEAAPSSLGCDQ